jgi:hypothetical protein
MKKYILPLIIILYLIFFLSSYAAISITKYEVNYFHSDNSIKKLTDGKLVIAGRDGTNTNHVKAQVLDFAIGTIITNTASVFNTTALGMVDVCVLDSTHIVCCYTRNTPPYYSYVVVGTVAGDDTITWGTEVEVYIGNVPYPSLCSLDSTHFAISYFETTIKTRVGVISDGNIITLGDAVTITSRDTDVKYHGNASFKTDSTHYLVQCQEDTYNNEAVYDVICTVANGDEVSLGTQYEATVQRDGQYRCVEWISSTKFITAYYGIYCKDMEFRIGSITNNDDIAYGTAQNILDFTGSNNYPTLSVLSASTVIVTYKNDDNSDYPTYRILTITDTNISVGDAVVIDTVACGNYVFSCDYYGDDRYAFVMYRDVTNSKTYVVVFDSGAVGWSHKWNTATISKWNTTTFSKWNGLE